MSDFGYRRPEFRLMDQKLTLSPETERMIAQLRADLASEAMLARLLNPDWDLQLFQSIATSPPPVTVSPPNPFLTMPPPSNPFFAPPPANPGPSAPLPPPPDPASPFNTGPHPGEMKHVFDALYKIPVTQNLMKSVKEEAGRQWNVFARDWKAAPTSENILFVSMTAVVAAGFIGPVIANKPARLFALDYLKDVDIPIPTFDGYSVKILEHGGGFETPLWIPGSKLNGSLELPGKGAVNYTITATVDLAKVWKALQ